MTKPLNRIFHNNNPNVSSVQLMEINEKTIDFIYQETDEEYKNFVKLFFATEEELKSLNVHEHLIPIDVKNMTYCGGGAIVSFDRKKWLRFLADQMKKKPIKLLPHSSQKFDKTEQ